MCRQVGEGLEAGYRQFRSVLESLSKALYVSSTAILFFLNCLVDQVILKRYSVHYLRNFTDHRMALIKEPAAASTGYASLHRTLGTI